MKILPKPVAFEWDKGNSHKSFIKHKVTSREAEESFDNEPFLISEDIKHSKNEIRFQALGKTNKGRTLFLSFTIRNKKIRVISIRNMSRKERRVYEQKIKINSPI